MADRRAIDVETLAGETAETLRRIADRRPRVHCLTNSVSQPITANTLLAVGAAPSLTADTDEMPDLIRSADALVINLGTPGHDAAALHELAVTVAKSAALPWVLDPVMIDRSDARRDRALTLLQQQPDAIRCNADEAAALAPALPRFIGTLACTGETDLVRKGARAARLRSGHPMLARVTATGCALSALVAAFLVIRRDDPFAACLQALSAFGAAGASAAAGADGPGSLAVRLLDGLSDLNEAQIAAHIDLSEEPK